MPAVNFLFIFCLFNIVISIVLAGLLLNVVKAQTKTVKEVQKLSDRISNLENIESQKLSNVYHESATQHHET